MVNKRVAAAIIAIILLKKKEKKKQKRKCWVKNVIKRRYAHGAHENLIKELRVEDPEQLKNFLRMSAEDFDFLLEKVRDRITKQDTKMRPAICASERLSVTLRFLATGASYNMLMCLYRIPVCTISRIDPECCAAIVEVLNNEYLKVPNTTDEWLTIAQDFNEMWNFPHCLGALDGKHVTIQAPINSGSFYFNYKGNHSVVLMGMANAHYEFLYTDVGCNGRVSDGGVYNRCSLSTAIEDNNLNIPIASEY